MPNVPSPNQDVIQSIEERPGNLNTGLIILVSNEPKNSNRPKLSNNGKKNPANKNIENNKVSKSLKTKLPVKSPIIKSGPIFNAVRTPNILPTTLVISHKGVVLKREFKNLLFSIKFGLKIDVIKVITPDIANVAANK